MKSLYTLTALILPLSLICNESNANEIAYSAKVEGHTEIFIADNKGKTKAKVTNFSGGNGYSAWSPNGEYIAFYAKYDERRTWSIHTVKRDGTQRKRLTNAKNTWDYGPAWSPDGKKIAFARTYRDANKVVQNEIWLMNPDGSDQTQIRPLKGGAPDFTPNGKIVFNAEFSDKKSEIAIADIDGKNITMLTHNYAEEWHPEVSPNGKHIAFMSNRDGNHEIYIMNIDGTNQTRLTHNNVDDWYPSWSPDGTKLIYSSTTDGVKSIYMMNKDGSSVTKIIENGSQAAWLKIRDSNLFNKI